MTAEKLASVTLEHLRHIRPRPVITPLTPQRPAPRGV